jgi:uroporphyrinogen-III decarboxylase
MLDMFRHKDKLLEALDRATKYNIGNIAQIARIKPGGHVFMPLHWGLGGFMSPEQFETFYWPQLRRVIMATIDEGLVPYVFWEGDCEERLETIADIPPGKAIYKFESTDLTKAKSVLGGIACVQGNVPASLLNTGTPEDVEEYCKALIRDVGKGGGFILDGAAGVPDEARYENVAAMVKAVRSHGQYG